MVKFENVSFGYGANHPIVDTVNFTLRRGMKVTLMGQNGAGKSTLFSLIMGVRKPEDGRVLLPRGLSVAISSQVVAPEDRELTIREFFEKRFTEKHHLSAHVRTHTGNNARHNTDTDTDTD